MGRKKQRRTKVRREAKVSFFEDRKKRWVVLALILVLAASIRVIHLRADPPANISASRALWTDEAFKNYNVRNKVLFGHWRVNEENDYRRNLWKKPMVMLLRYSFLKVIGVGFAQARLVSVLLSIITLVVLFFWTKKFLGYVTSIMGLSFLGLNYNYFVFSRVGTYEQLYILLIVLTGFFLHLGKKRGIYYLLSGITLYLLYSIKMTGLFLFGVVGIYWLYLFWRRKNKDLKRLLRNIGLFVGGLIIAVIVFKVLYYIMQPPIKEGRVVPEALTFFFPRGLGEFFRTTLSVAQLTNFFRDTPIISICFAFGLMLMVTEFFTHPKDDKRDELFFLLWAVLGLGALSVFQYRPPRLYVFLAPPLSLLGAYFLSWLIEGEEKISPIQRIHKIPLVINFIIFSFLVYNFVCFALLWIVKSQGRGASRSLIRFISSPPKMVIATGIIAGIIFCLWIRKNPVIRGRRWAKGIAIAAAFLVIILQLRNYSQWVNNRTYTLFNSAKEVAQLLKGQQDALVAGPWAPTLLFEDKIHQAIPFYGNKKVNTNADLFEKFKVTHLALEENSGWDYLFVKQTYPEIWKKAKRLRAFNIGGRYRIDLMEVDPGSVEEYKGRIAAMQIELAQSDSAFAQNDPERYIRRAEIFQKNFKFEKAIDMYKTALNLSPSNVDLYNRIAYLCYNMQLWEEARKFLRWGLKIDPHNPTLRKNLEVLGNRR